MRDEQKQTPQDVCGEARKSRVDIVKFFFFQWHTHAPSVTFTIATIISSFTINLYFLSSHHFHDNNNDNDYDNEYSLSGLRFHKRGFQNRPV